MTDAGDKPLVEYDCRDHIATITLSRPDKLNAVNDDMVRQIASALQRFDVDNEARVAILCGRGRAFSSGADVHQRQLRSRAEFERHGGAQAQDAQPSMADFFETALSFSFKEPEIGSFVHRTPFENLDIIPSHPNLETLQGKLELTPAAVSSKGGNEAVYVPIEDGARLTADLGGLVSIHAGLEDAGDLIIDLENGLTHYICP